MTAKVDFCPHCGTQVIESDDQFCRRCGQPITLFQEAGDGSSKFCACGMAAAGRCSVCGVPLCQTHALRTPGGIDALGAMGELVFARPGGSLGGRALGGEDRGVAFAGGPVLETWDQLAAVVAAYNDSHQVSCAACCRQRAIEVAAGLTPPSIDETNPIARGVGGYCSGRIDWQSEMGGGSGLGRALLDLQRHHADWFETGRVSRRRDGMTRDEAARLRWCVYNGEWDTWYLYVNHDGLMTLSGTGGKTGPSVAFDRSERRTWTPDARRSTEQEPWLSSFSEYFDEQSIVLLIAEQTNPQALRRLRALQNFALRPGPSNRVPA
jgi:hypothetical protein